MKSLDDHIRELTDIFQNKDRYAAHQQARPVLQEMESNVEIFHDILRKNLSDPDFLLKERVHPIIGLPIVTNDDFELVAHCWLPLPDRSTDRSHQSIHHHGNLLLTSVAAWGEGYESVLFKPGPEIDPATGNTKLEVDKVYHNPKGNLEFVPTDTCHVVFFPKTFSITYALWSSDKPYAANKLKRNPLLQKLKGPLLTVLKLTGLSRSLGVNVVQEFDFYPEGDKIKVLRERIFGYEPVSNDNLMQNIAFMMQATGFDDRAFLQNLLKTAPAGAKAAQKWLTAVIEGQTVSDCYDPRHVNVDPRVNIRRDHIMTALGLPN